MIFFQNFMYINKLLIFVSIISTSISNSMEEINTSNSIVNNISTSDYSKAPSPEEIQDLSALYNKIDTKLYNNSSLVAQLKNIDDVKNEIGTLLDRLNINNIPNINIKEIENNIKTLLNKLNEYNIENIDNVKSNIKTLLEKLNIDNINSINSTKNDVEKSLSNLNINDEKSINAVKYGVKNLLDKLDGNINSMRNDIKRLLNNFNVNNINDIKDQIKELLKKLNEYNAKNINNTKNSIKTLLNNLNIDDIEHIVDVKYDIKELLDNSYKYNLSIKRLNNRIHATIFAYYLDNLLVHYDPITREYDKYKLLKQYFRNGNPHSPIMKLKDIPFEYFFDEELYKIIKKQPEIVSIVSYDDKNNDSHKNRFKSELLNGSKRSIIKVLSEENSIDNMYKKLQLMLPGQPSNAFYMMDNYDMMEVNGLLELAKSVQSALVWNNYYLKNNIESFNLDSIEYSSLLNIDNKKLHLLHSLFAILSVFKIYLQDFIDSNKKENETNLKNFDLEKFNLEKFKEFLIITAEVSYQPINNSNAKDELYSNAFMELFRMEYNRVNKYIYSDFVFYDTKVSITNVQNQIKGYLNELENNLNKGSKISKENPLTYDNTVGFFKRLIEDYFKEIRKKN